MDTVKEILEWFEKEKKADVDEELKLVVAKKHTEEAERLLKKIPQAKMDPKYIWLVDDTDYGSKAVFSTRRLAIKFIEQEQGKWDRKGIYYRDGEALPTYLTKYKIRRSV